MRFLMLMALLLATMPLAAQNWVKVDETDDTVVYIDPGTIRSNGHQRRTWGLYDLRKRDQMGVMSRRALLEFDCKEDRRRILTLSTHGDRMAGGPLIDYYDEPDRWRYIPPGTPGETMFKIVCAVRQ